MRLRLSRVFATALAVAGAALPAASSASASALGSSCYPWPTVWPVDAAGKSWFSESEGDIGQISATGAITETGLGGGDITGVTTGPDGATWFTFVDSSDRPSLGRLAPGGGLTTYAMPPLPVAGGGFPKAGALVWAADGYMYTVMADYPYAARISTSGAVSYIPLPSTASGLVRGPDGAAWFSGYASVSGITDGVIGRLGRAGITAQYRYVSEGPGVIAHALPGPLADGPDRRLWFTLGYTDTTSGSEVGAVTLSGAFSFYKVASSFVGEDAISSAPDGNEWVLISYPNEILELNPKGTVVSRRALPTPFGPAASGMASAVDGRVWLGDYRNLYAISMSGPQATLYPPASTLQACQSSATQVARGEQISLWGRALDQATSVTLGITPAAFTIVSPVQLAITIPAGAPAGEASLSVGSATGSSSLPYPVDVEDPPTITSVSPSCGSPSGGDLIEVQGTELDAVTSATVGGQAATIDTSYKFGQSPSENSVWIYTPQHTLPATVDVRVRTVAGTSPVSPADHFTYSLTCGGV